MTFTNVLESLITVWNVVYLMMQKWYETEVTKLRVSPILGESTVGGVLLLHKLALTYSGGNCSRRSPHDQ